jgi:hemolysin III
VAGGLAYSVGVVFFVTDDMLSFGHLIWHLFVIAGTACHFVAVRNYSHSMVAGGLPEMS